MSHLKHRNWRGYENARYGASGLVSLFALCLLHPSTIYSANVIERGTHFWIASKAELNRETRHRTNALSAISKAEVARFKEFSLRLGGVVRRKDYEGDRTTEEQGLRKIQDYEGDRTTKEQGLRREGWDVAFFEASSPLLPLPFQNSAYEITALTPQSRWFRTKDPSDESS